MSDYRHDRLYPKKQERYPALTAREKRDLERAARKAKGGETDRVELYKNGSNLGIRSINYER